MAPRRPRGESRERIFRFVRDHILAGRPPTVREVQEAFGFRAVESARSHLEALVADGRLVKADDGKARGYGLPAQLVGAPPTWVPLLGRVQAGALTTAIEDPEGYIPARSRPGGQLFALRVRGESMTGAGILPGDVVVVRSQRTADPGDTVVALVEDEATVKTLRIRDGRVELHAENPDFEPIVPPPDDLMLLGKVVEVRRYLEAERFEEPRP